jgi:ATP-binding cassette subfamily B protein
MLTGFVIGALMAINGQITVGTYLAYAGLVVWLIWPMRNLGRLIVQTSTGIVSFSRWSIISRVSASFLRATRRQDIRKICFENVC